MFNPFDLTLQHSQMCLSWLAKVFDTRPKQLESLENGLFRLAAATVAAVTASNGKLESLAAWKYQV
jgi:hypothetical protein